MTESGNDDRNYSDCKAPGRHREHLCILMDRGQTDEIRRRSDHPAFTCRNCGAMANERDDLCNPEPL